MPEELENQGNQGSGSDNGNPDDSSNTGNEGNEGGSQGNETSFIDVIPEDHREQFKEFESAEDFVKHYSDLKKSNEDLQSKIPAVPEKYETPENVTIDESSQKNVDAFTKFCKDDLGLTQDQYNKLLVATLQHDQQVIQDVQTQADKVSDKEFEKILSEEAKATEEELTKEWGNAYEQNLEAAQKVIGGLADEEFVNYLNETGLGNDVRFVRAMYKFSTLISEDSFVEGKIQENDVERDSTGRPVLKFNWDKK